MEREDMRWLRTVASDYSYSGAIDADDVAQEGALAWWLAAKDDNRMNFNFYRQAARWRMKNAAFEGRQSGSERAHGASLKYSAEASDSSLWDSRRIHHDPDVEIAYHQKEIMDAILGLPPGQRRYVLLRFYHGFNHPELTQEFGYDPAPLWRKARMKLKEKLSHLKGITDD